MLTHLAAFVIRFRWWVIGGWVVVFLISAAFAPRVTSQLKHGFGDLDTESRAALRLMTEELGFTESSVTLVFSSDSLDVDDPTYVEQMERAFAPLRQRPEVARIITFYSVQSDTFVSEDRRTTYAFVELDVSLDEAVDLAQPIRDSLGDTDLDVWVTGGIALFADLSIYSERDLQRAELITIPLLAILLLIVFGSVVAAGLPVAMGALSVVTTLALVFLVAQATDMSIFVLNIASFLGLGMAVDYSLLMVSRFREELQGADGVAVAVTTTIETSGKAIVFSAGTSVIALSGLLFFDFMMMRSLGVGGITVIFFSMLIALTLLPALFAVLGHRVDRLSIWRRRTVRGGFWFNLSQWVMRHSIAVIIPTTALLVLLGLPFLNVNLGSPWASILPEEAESRQGQELVNERFGPGELAQVILVETSPTSTLSPQNIAATLEFVQRMQNDSRVVRVDSIYGTDLPDVVGASFAPAPTNLIGTSRAVSDETLSAFGELVSDDLRTQTIRVVPVHSPTADETKSLVSDIRSNPLGGDMTVLVTGITADQLDNVDSMYSDFPRVIVYVVIVTYIALLLLFRSVLLPLKAVVLNALSILASFGAIVFVFQQGNFERILGFTADGTTEATVPILVFS
ncbi:MAG: MMPL family transporter [Dehalococcoidia bacterium]|nr:MMPL family transporter [Dehalococcoidia bacterium]